MKYRILILLLLLGALFAAAAVGTKSAYRTDMKFETTITPVSRNSASV